MPKETFSCVLCDALCQLKRSQRFPLSRLFCRVSGSACASRADTVAERAGIARKTLYRAEQGEPAVTLGTYLKILGVLHLQTDLDRLAKDDILGRRLQDLELPKPLRQRGSV
jgi:transcriptional regulator with XRE-family HTH domain